MDESPVTVTELLQLTQLGIPLEHITWPRVTMTSDQWICIRHGKQGRSVGRQLRASFISLLNPCRADFPQTWQTTAGSVMMNPNKPVLALKVGKDFQIYNLDTRQVICHITFNMHVEFWRWISGTTIAIVTKTAVYHWDLSTDKTEPWLVFNRHIRLRDTAIVNYIVDATFKWYALLGLLVEDDRICGITQIHSVEHDLSQPIEAHAVTFCSYTLPGNQHPSTLLVAVVRETSNQGKIHIIELGPHAPGNQAPTRRLGDLVFEDDWEKYDFPVSVQVSITLGLVFIITKYGQLHLCDLESGQFLSKTRVCADILFVATISSDGMGVLTISRNGQVILISVKAAIIASYVRHSLQRPLIAERLEKVTKDLCQMHLLSI